MDEKEMKKCAEVFDEIRKELPLIVSRVTSEGYIKKPHETIKGWKREDALAGRQVPWTWAAEEKRKGGE